MQCAIVFTTPPYIDKAIQRPVEVWLQLKRGKDKECSESLPFTYRPEEYGMCEFFLNVYLQCGFGKKQGRRKLLDAQGQNREMRPPASEASRKCFRSHPSDWLKIHFRAFPVVKI